jgi:hypothetical protein
MTTTDRNLINNAATGLLIFNTTTGCLEINLGTGTAFWQSIICTPGSVTTLDCGSRTFNNFPLVPGQAATNQSITIPYTGGNGFDHDGQVVQYTRVTGLTATLSAGTLASRAETHGLASLRTAVRLCVRPCVSAFFKKKRFCRYMPCFATLRKISNHFIFQIYLPLFFR